MGNEAVDQAIADQRRADACEKAIFQVLEQFDCVILPYFQILGSQIDSPGFSVNAKESAIIIPPQMIKARTQAAFDKIGAILKLHNCVVVPRVVFLGAQIVESGCIVHAIPLDVDMKKIKEN